MTVRSILTTVLLMWVVMPSPGGYRWEPMPTRVVRPPARKQTVPKRVTTSTLRTRASTQRGTVLVPYSYRAWGSSSGSFCGPSG